MKTRAAGNSKWHQGLYGVPGGVFVVSMCKSLSETSCSVLHDIILVTVVAENIVHYFI